MANSELSCIGLAVAITTRSKVSQLPDLDSLLGSAPHLNHGKNRKSKRYNALKMLSMAFYVSLLSFDLRLHMSSQK